jgi:hypothetical protein
MPLSETWERDCSRARVALQANPFDTDCVEFRRLVGQLSGAVRDPTMHRSVYKRVVNAVASNLITSFEVREILEAVDRNKPAHRGRYFIACVKHLFQVHSIPW